MAQVSGFIKVDGTSCGGNVLYLGHSRVPIIISKSTVPTSLMTEKPFMFSPLELTGIIFFQCQLGREIVFTSIYAHR